MSVLLLLSVAVASLTVLLMVAVSKRSSYMLKQQPLSTAVGFQAMADILLGEVSDGIVVCDNHARIQMLNRAAERMFGFSNKELKGKPLGSLLEHKGKKLTSEQWFDHLTPDQLVHQNLTGLHKNGSRLSLETSVSLLQVDDAKWCVTILRDTSGRKMQEERLSFLASHDMLTGLINRHQFEHSLQQLLDDRLSGWLFFLNLDDFKLLNDALGYAVGDAALIAVARRLKNTLGEEILLCRYGGDEFAVFAPAVSGVSEDKLLYAIEEMLTRPVVHDGMEFRLSASIGVVQVTVESEYFQVLFRQADMALSEAKRRGKNKIAFFSEDMAVEFGRKSNLATRLKSLSLDNELLLYLQPRVGLPDRDLLGAEALLRWKTPEGELISPSEFIPLAEETGQIIRIGYWVMDKVCAWLAEHSSQSEAFVVSINLSPRQLYDERLVDRIEALREQYGLAAAQIEFEITEGTALQNPQNAMRVLTRLRALGYGLSMDDFGTGYSSLSQLRVLPVSTLKVDQSFVLQMLESRQDRLLVAAIIDLAGHLGLSTLAEGVETAEQLDLLDAMGCNEVQGYLMGRPLPAKEFADNILSSWNQYSRTLDW